MRTYVVKPEHLDDYLRRCADTADVRRGLNPGFLGFWVTEIGGDVNEVTHVYAYDDYDHRDAVRRAMKDDPRWAAFIADTKPALVSQKSEMFMAATAAMKAAGIADPATHLREAAERSGGGVGGGGAGVYEIRTYQLELGYNPIPKLIGHMAEGLPSKLASDPGAAVGASKGRLMFMGYSDVGKLNQFVEIWRYPSFQDHILVREGARTAAKWRETIQAIAPMVQMFDTRLVVPAECSPLQ